MRGVSLISPSRKDCKRPFFYNVAPHVLSLGLGRKKCLQEGEAHGSPFDNRSVQPHASMGSDARFLVASGKRG